MKKNYKLKLIKKPEIREGDTFIATGFHGFGAVGFLASRYIVSKLGMDLVGYIETPWIPDFTSVEDYGFSMPHEIFYKNVDGTNIFVLVNRINPDRRYMSSFVNEFIEFVKTVGNGEVVLIGGLDTRFREGNEEYRWIKTSTCKRTLNAPYFIKGAYVVGPLASLMIALQHHGIPAMVLLPYTQPETVDHRAAAVAVRVFSEISNVRIDVDELLQYVEKVEEIERMVQELYEQQKRGESIMHT